MSAEETATPDSENVNLITTVESKSEGDNPVVVHTKDEGTMDATKTIETNNESENAAPAVEEKATKDNNPETEQKTTEATVTCAATKSNEFDEYAEHVTYTEDGSAIYTDPNTKQNYLWCTEKNTWVPTTNETNNTSSAYENEHYKWCSETQQWLPKTQVTETEHYKWNAEKNEWIPKAQASTTTEAAETQSSKTTSNENVTYGIDEDGQRIYTDEDGAVFFWDAKKSAWFPKIDDDFMARYQMNYGFIDNTSASEAEKCARDAQEAKRKAEELQRMEEEAKQAMEDTAAGVVSSAGKRKAVQEPAKWFDVDPAQNTKVYVWNLPLDITIEEFAEVMGKCGLIMRDPQTQKFKLKLYSEPDGQLKGDGLCDYIKVESVDLALNILDEYNLRGHKIRVQRAKFQMRGEYNPALKPKRKKKDKEKLQKIKEKLFDWRPDKMRGERSKNEKIVIIKNLFQPDIFQKEVHLILEYQNDLREECAKCGTVRKVVVFDRHPEGVAQINMATPEEADLVIQMMQGRFFGQRQLTADHWDGKTKYKSNESEKETQQRLNNWDQFLQTDEAKGKLLQPLNEQQESDIAVKAAEQH